MSRLSDDDLLAICLGEISNSEDDGDLASEREDALKRYLGEPYGDEVDGRSQVRTRETMETVEGLMPSLMRIFSEEENLVIFQPTGPEDEEQAEQETDIVNHVFWNENRGFYNVYSFAKDALLSKTGILKCWADKSSSKEREEYEGLDDMQLGQLLNEPYVEREVIEYELKDEGHHVVFMATRDNCDIQVMPIAPEEFGIKRDARSPYISDSSFVYCRFKKTIGELLSEGIDRDKLESLGTDDDYLTEERIARYNKEDEQENSWTDEFTSRSVWVTEAYARIDKNGDGIPELWKVVIGGGLNNSGTLLDIEEVDSVPLFATPAVPVTHKFYGMSIADLVMDLQEIQTTLLRQVLDNTYLANNGQTAVNTDYVNLEDMMTRRPGGISRFQGDMPWSAVIGAIPHNPLPPQTSELFERLDERQRRRTGYGDEVGALDMGALTNVNTGVAALAFDMARAKLELLARVIAEIGFKPLMHHIHELMIKNKYQSKALKIRNKWVQSDPAEWKTRKNSRVTIGIGKVSRERKIMGFEALMAKQQELVTQGAMGTLLMPWHLYESYKGWVGAWGFEPDLYIQDPRKLPPPPPKGPDPQQQALEAQSQAMLMDGQSKLMRAQNEQQKIQLEAKKAEVEAQYKQAEIFMRAEIETLRQRQIALKSETDTAGKVASLQQQLLIKDTDKQIEVMRMRLEHLDNTRDRDLEYYKALTTMAAKGQVPGDEEAQAESDAEATAKEAADAQKAMQREMMDGQRDKIMVEMFNELRGFIEESRSPQPVEYDEKGLIKVIGKRSVTRDPSGKVVQIG